MLRSLILSTTLLVLLPVILRYPSAGVLVWAWLSLFNPHQMVYGFGAHFGFSFWVAVTTLGAWLLSREPKLPPPGATTLLMAGMLLWVVVTQLTALAPDFSYPFFDRAVRVLVLALVVLTLMRTKARLHALVWIYVLSIAFFSVKGGLFTLLTGGQYRIYGPEDTPINDNNHLGLVMVAIIPLIYYLWRHTEQRWVRRGLLALLGLTVLSVLGTYSRGAFIAALAMGGMFWLRSQAKLQTALLALGLAIPAYAFMPPSYYERIASIGGASEDGSFQGRLAMWDLCWHIAQGRPLFGVGLRGHYLESIAQRFMDVPPTVRAAHSIYFELLGSMGFPGLLLFLALCAVAWFNAAWVMRRCRDLPQLAWARDMAAMNQASLAGFLVGGAALSMEMWAGLWIQLSLLAALRLSVARGLAAGTEHRTAAGPAATLAAGPASPVWRRPAA